MSFKNGLLRVRLLNGKIPFARIHGGDFARIRGGEFALIQNGEFARNVSFCPKIQIRGTDFARKLFSCANMLVLYTGLFMDNYQPDSVTTTIV